MIFLADESLDLPIIKYLRGNGLDVIAIAEIQPSIDDEKVLEIANDEGRILITLDKDFGELVFRLRKVHSGIVLLRLDEVPLLTKIDLLLELIEKRGDELSKSFTVVQKDLVRIRHIK